MVHIKLFQLGEDGNMGGGMQVRNTTRRVEEMQEAGKEYLAG
jgi:hypothetical protein